jgi:L-ascorbate 6-phosphate lactonase
MISNIFESRISGGELGVFWLWQNSYILKSPEGVLVAIDPYLVKHQGAQHMVGIPMRPEEMQVDYVFCTHDHWDHANPETLEIIGKSSPNTVFIGTPECYQRFLSAGIPGDRARALGPEETIALRGFKATALYSIPPKASTAMGQTTHYGYVFDFGFARLYNFGDSIAETVAEPLSVLGAAILYHPEVAIFPIVGDFPERRPEDAVAFAKIVKPRVVIPGHYGCFVDRTVDPRIFVDLMTEVRGTEAVVIERGGLYVYKSQFPESHHP